MNTTTNETDMFNKWKSKINNEIDYEFDPFLSYEDNKIKFNDIIIRQEIYNRLINSVKKICQGYSKILFVQGPPGHGKSRQIRNILTEEKSNFLELSGDITEAYLYRLLYENNGKIIWCKDMVKMLKNQGMINLLKAATETEEECLLSKNNYSNYQVDLPEYFYCNCKFIFDFNTINSPGLKEDMDALVSRGELINIQLSKNQIIRLMNHIAKTDNEKIVTKYLIETINNKPYVNINLRTQYNAIKTFEYCKQNNLDWKKSIEELFIEHSKNISLLYSIIGKESIKSSELKKILIKKSIVNSKRTADRLIEKMLFIDELIKLSANDKNYLLKLNI